MSTPLRDDDPVHVLPEDGDVVVPLVESRGGDFYFYYAAALKK